MFSACVLLFLVYFLWSSIAIILISVRFIANPKENWKFFCYLNIVPLTSASSPLPTCLYWCETALNLTSAYYEVSIILPSVLVGEVEAVSEKSKQTSPQQGAQWHFGVQRESPKISLSYVLLMETDSTNCLRDKLYCMTFPLFTFFCHMHREVI